MSNQMFNGYDRYTRRQPVIVNNNNTASGGVGLVGAVFLVLFILKLIGKIDLSWWWVTAPLWGSVAIVVVILLIGLIVATVAVYRKDRKYKKAKNKKK